MNLSDESRRRLAVAFAVLVGVVSLANAAVFLRAFQPAPYYDMVDVETFLARWSLARDGLGPIATYPDNEHRSIAPLLLQALDHKVFASTGVFLILVHLACFAGFAAVGARRMAAVLPAGAARIAGGAAVVAATLWSAHWNNIARLKQTHLAIALVTLALTFLLLAAADTRLADARRGATRRGAWACVAGAGLMLINAVWSFAAGLAAAPAAVIFVVARPWPWAPRLTVVAAAAVAVGTRAWSSAVAPSGVKLPAETPDLVTQIHYALNFVGGFARPALGGDEIVAPILGALGLAAAVPLLVLALRRDGWRAQAERGAATSLSYFALLLLWALICAAFITPNRAGFGADQAFVSRYLVFSVAFWLGWVGIAAARRDVPPARAMSGVKWASVVFVAAFLATTPRGWLLALEHNRRVALSAVTAALDINDVQYTLYPGDDDGRIAALMADYRARPASFFRRDWGRWLGQPVEEAFGPDALRRCRDTTAAVALRPIDPAAPDVVRLEARVRGRPPAWLAVVDANGDVAGLARRGERFRTAPRPVLSDDASGAPYAGFARTAGGEAAAIVAAFGYGAACAPPQEPAP